MSEENQSEQNISTNDKVSGKSFFKKSRGCPFASGELGEIDYKSPELLKKFISEGGRMLPSRITNVSAHKQRELKAAIKQARILALLPFVYSNK